MQEIIHYLDGKIVQIYNDIIFVEHIIQKVEEIEDQDTNFGEGQESDNITTPFLYPLSQKMIPASQIWTTFYSGGRYYIYTTTML